MLSRLISFILIITAFSMFCGCTTGAFQQGTLLDSNWGRSYETARTQQMLNPEAGKNLNPVEGLDGDAAMRSLEHYRKAFEQTPKESAYTINLTPVGAGK